MPTMVLRRSRSLMARVLVSAVASAGATACDGAKESKPAAAAKDKPADGTQDTQPKPEPKPEPKPAAPTAPVGVSDAAVALDRVDPKTLLGDDGTYNYSKDAFGELSTGLADKDVIAKLGEPKSKDGREEEGATGDIVDLWHYPQQGIVLTMYSQTMTSAQSISGITIEPPCAFKTKLGVGIGSKRADVLAAYGAFEDPEFPAEPAKFIAGSVYGGTFFDFEKDEVVSIFMGAGAE